MHALHSVPCLSRIRTHTIVSPLIDVRLTIQTVTRPLYSPLSIGRTGSRFSKPTSVRMSGAHFSNASTGDKPADPYKEKNYDNSMSVKDKVDGLNSFIRACRFGMMTTRQAKTGLLENGIDLIFHTNTESGKTDELHSDPMINIAFLNNSSEWASISGEASILTDRESVRKHYSSALKAWIGDLGDGKHDGGPDDPRIGVIRVKTITATYAVSHGNAVSRGIEIAKGVVTGNIPDVNRVRELSEEEVTSFRKLSTGSK